MQLGAAGLCGGGYELVARVRQSDITSKLTNVNRTVERVVSKTGGQVYGVEDIITRRSR